jgi:uncharacterized protein (TIGR02145 family)
MTNEEAHELLDLEPGASAQEIRNAYKEVFNELQIRLTNAPTDHQKQMYRRRLREVEEAYLFLGGETEEDISELPSIGPVEVPADKPAAQSTNEPMSQQAALQLLALSQPFTPEKLDEAYQSKKAEFEKSLQNAPNDIVKRGFQHSLVEIYQALIILQPHAETPKPVEKTPPPVAKKEIKKTDKPKKSKAPFFWLVGVAAIVIITLLIWQPWGSTGTFTDSRDGKTYKTVRIGNQTWMAENLNYATSIGSWCYDDNPENCEKYGRLYDWETAKKVCPSGWHLPSDAEWTTLLNFVGIDAGTKLKSTSGWSSGGNGNDSYGFSAFPGGVRTNHGNFSYIGDYGYWWSSAESSSTNVWRRLMSSNTGRVYRYSSPKAYGFSVRCLRD